MNAPQRAAELGCEVFQMFTRSPQGGKAPEITTEISKQFKEEMKKWGQDNCYIHAPYYINLASAKNNIYYGSISVLREELERGSVLGAKYLMTHLGSAKELGRKDALKKVVQGIEKILTGYNGKTKFLIEMSAGAGEIIGDTFEEIYSIIHNTKPIIQKNIGVCFDTAHVFESGYDLTSVAAVKNTFDQFDKIIGLKYLKLIHVNDSKTALGARVDRHEHLGLGKIGLDGFQALVNEPRLKNIDFILETPTDKGVRKDIKLLKQLRKQV